MESVCHQLGPHILHDIVNKYRVLYRVLLQKGSWERKSVCRKFPETAPPPHGPDRQAASPVLPCGPAALANRTDKIVVMHQNSPTGSILAHPKDQCSSSIVGLSREDMSHVRCASECLRRPLRFGASKCCARSLKHFGSPLGLQHFGPRCVGMLDRTTVSSSCDGRAQHR